MDTTYRVGAIVFAWWIFLTAHPSQPLFGPYANPQTCLGAIVHLSADSRGAARLAAHGAIDCRQFEVKP